MAAQFNGVNLMQLAQNQDSLTVQGFMEEVKCQNDTDYFQTFWPVIIRNQEEIILDDKICRWLGFSGKITDARYRMRSVVDKNEIHHKSMTYEEVFEADGLVCSFECQEAHNLKQIKKIYVLSIDAFKELCMIVGTKKGHELRKHFIKAESESINNALQLQICQNQLQVCQKQLQECQNKLAMYESINSPNKTQAKSITKDDHINELYAELFPYFQWQARNKPPENDCSIRRRPDYYVILPTHILILEVDEKQHKKYDPKDENVRTNQLTEAFNNKPIIYVRFNPDQYKLSNGVVIAGCFRKNNGVLMMDKEKIIKRLQVVHSVVLKHCDANCAHRCLQNDLVRQIYLFYDGFDCDF